MMLLLLAITWDEAKGYLVGGIGGGGLLTLLLWFLNYFKDRPKDKVSNERTEAEIKKIEAEAYKVRAETDVTVADSALKLAQRLSDDNEMYKKQLTDTKTQLDQAQIDLRSALRTVEDLQYKLNQTLQNNLLMEQELKDLKEELKKLKGSGNE